MPRHNKPKDTPSRRMRRALIFALINRDGPDCAICGEFLHPQARTFDHIQARSKGGTDDLDNLRLAHFKCNTRRRDGMG